MVIIIFFWFAFFVISVIVKASSGPRYVVGCRNKVDKEKLTAGTRVVLDMTTLTIMRALPREVRCHSLFFWDMYLMNMFMFMFLLGFLIWIICEIHLLFFHAWWTLIYHELTGWSSSLQYAAWGSRQCQLLRCWWSIWSDKGIEGINWITFDESWTLSSSWN